MFTFLIIFSVMMTSKRRRKSLRSRLRMLGKSESTQLVHFIVYYVLTLHFVFKPRNIPLPRTQEVRRRRQEAAKQAKAPSTPKRGAPEYVEAVPCPGHCFADALLSSTDALFYPNVVDKKQSVHIYIFLFVHSLADIVTGWNALLLFSTEKAPALSKSGFSSTSLSTY